MRLPPHTGCNLAYGFMKQVVLIRFSLCCAFFVFALGVTRLLLGVRLPLFLLYCGPCHPPVPRVRLLSGSRYCLLRHGLGLPSPLLPSCGACPLPVLRVGLSSVARVWLVWHGLCSLRRPPSSLVGSRSVVTIHSYIGVSL